MTESEKAAAVVRAMHERWFKSKLNKPYFYELKGEKLQCWGFLDGKLQRLTLYGGYDDAQISRLLHSGTLKEIDPPHHD